MQSSQMQMANKYSRKHFVAQVPALIKTKCTKLMPLIPVDKIWIAQKLNRQPSAGVCCSNCCHNWPTSLAERKWAAFQLLQVELTPKTENKIKKKKKWGAVLAKLNTVTAAPATNYSTGATKKKIKRKKQNFNAAKIFILPYFKWNYLRWCKGCGRSVGRRRERGMVLFYSAAFCCAAAEKRVMWSSAWHAHCQFVCGNKK